MNNSMLLYIRTLGKNPGCPIVSVSAVPFDEKTEVGTACRKGLHRNICLETCMALGMAPEAKAILWWIRHGNEPGSPFLDNEPMSLEAALSELSNFVDRMEIDEIWCQSLSDILILGAAYGLVAHKLNIKIPIPWANRSVLDVLSVEKACNGANVGEGLISRLNQATKCLELVRNSV